MNEILYIVVPCYNEEAVLPETSRRLREKLETLAAMGKISPQSRVLFVNDGSKDRTWEIIRALHEECPLFSGVDLTRNRGHQNALLAGLMTAKDRCDMAISMDADLQDDVDAVDAMVDKFQEGCDIVYGVRSSRAKDTFFKRFTAEGFYRLMSLMGAETVFNHADYRLMSRRALESVPGSQSVPAGHRADGGLSLGRGGVRAGGALCGREQVPAEKDALLRHGGHHQPVHQAHPLYHAAGLFDFPGFHRHAGHVHRQMGPGHDGGGLGQRHLLRVGHRRADPALPGGHWRIYRQDLSGDQAAAPVPDPYGAGGRRWVS